MLRVNTSSSPELASPGGRVVPSALPSNTGPHAALFFVINKSNLATIVMDW